MLNQRIKTFLDCSARQSIDVFLWGSGIIFLLLCFVLSSFGLDLSDEGFYLVTMSNPFEYGATISQFGFLLNPVYQMLEGDVAALRILNIVVTFGLAFALANLFMACLFRDVLDIKSRLTIAFSLATLSLISFYAWRITPGYNSLTFQAMLITTAGIFLLIRAGSGNILLSAVLVGAGGWLAFMAKPTTAMILALIVPLSLAVAGRLSIKWLLQAAIVSFIGLLVGALLIDGSMLKFMHRMSEGAEFVSTLGHKGHGFQKSIRLDWFRVDAVFIYVSLAIMAAATLLGWAAGRLSVSSNDAKFPILMTVVGVLALCLIVVVDPKTILGNTRFPFALILTLPASVLLFVMVSFLGQSTTFSFKRIKREHWGLMVLLMLMPYAYAFGTGTNYWHKYPLVGLFWVLGAVVLFVGFGGHQQRTVKRLLTLVAVISILIIALMLKSSIQYPQRQPIDLLGNDFPLLIGKEKTEVVLNKEVGHYLQEVKNAASGAEFAEGMALLDMTGQSPGVAYILGAEAPGIAWMTGGYPGSETVVKNALDKVHCEELANAWLLTEPAGPRAIAADLLMSFGAEMGHDYQVVGEFLVPSGTGGRKQSQKQYLLKPARELSSAVRACEQARENRS